MSDRDDKPADNPDGEVQIDSRQIIKLLVEMGPLVVFFIANFQGGIFVGTAWFMGATAISLTASRFILGSIPLMPLISGAFILVFGALTLWLNDSTFIKLKPTIVNLLFSAILFGGIAFGKSLLRYVLGEAFNLTDEGWRILTIRWALFFLFLAGLNEVIWRNFSEDFWVSFKLWGLMPITMIFAMSQVGLLQRYEKPSS
ncbi:MAG: septation protein A [Alphaproteobacteria bacterium]|nr:septation protein A [Alphaproteobacteria bacterium]